MEGFISLENWIYFFHLNPEILAKLFNLIYYLILRERSNIIRRFFEQF